jgi:hypothetical protein
MDEDCEKAFRKFQEDILTLMISGVMVCKKKLPPAILQMMREANLQMLIFLQICR